MTMGEAVLLIALAVVVAGLVLPAAVFYSLLVCVVVAVLARAVLISRGL